MLNGPGHRLVHFIEQDLLARAPSAEIEAAVCLFHAATASNSRASIAMMGAWFLL